MNNLDIIERSEEHIIIPPSGNNTPSTTTPNELLFAAINGGVDLQRLERIIELRDRWEAKEAERAFNNAMAEFQKACPQIKKDKTVGYTTKEGVFVGYKYASLGEIIKTIHEPLAKNGLSFRFIQDDSATLISITCIISHATGHSISNTLSGLADKSGSKNAIQAVGSTVTYLQRYTLSGLLGLSTTDDDDGQGGSKERPRGNDDLMQRAANHAIQGTAAYEQFFKSLTKHEQRRLKETEHENLKSVATEHDGDSEQISLDNL